MRFFIDRRVLESEIELRTDLAVEFVADRLGFETPRLAVTERLGLVT